MRPPPSRLDRFNGRCQGLWTQDHARATTVGGVVDLTVASGCKVARIGASHANDAVFDGFADEAGAQERSEDLGKERQQLYVEERGRG